MRDVRWREDAGQLRVGNVPRALAALRKSLLSLFRRQGWENMADAMRHYGASVSRVLRLIGTVPARL